MAINATNLSAIFPQSFLTQNWNAIFDHTTDNPFVIYCFGVSLVLGVFYWTVGCFYIYLDVVNPKWVRKYKLQPGKNEPVDLQELKIVIKQVVFNQFVLGPYFAIITYPILMLAGLDTVDKIRTIPSLTTIVIQVAGCILIREVVFYYSHRLLHTRLFYERHHKKHHQWTAPIAVSAQYADEIEHLFSNLAPVMIPVGLFGCNLVTTMIFFVHVNLRTLNDHSGYNFPYYYNSKRHDHHHKV